MGSKGKDIRSAGETNQLMIREIKRQQGKRGGGASAGRGKHAVQNKSLKKAQENQT